MNAPKYKVGDTVLVSWPSKGKLWMTIDHVYTKLLGHEERTYEAQGLYLRESQIEDARPTARGFLGGPIDDVPPVALDAVNTRTQILRTAESLITGDRANDYDTKDDATGNFNRIAKLWEPILGVEITATDVALMLTQLKVARLIVNPTKEDSWVDACGYLALGGEISNDK